MAEGLLDLILTKKEEPAEDGTVNVSIMILRKYEDDLEHWLG